MNRIEAVRNSHPYINTGAVRAMLVLMYDAMKDTSTDLQDDLDKTATGLAAMSKDEILNFRATVEERYAVPLSDFDSVFDD